MSHSQTHSPLQEAVPTARGEGLQRAARSAAPKVLVTGAYGYTGGRIAQALARGGGAEVWLGSRNALQGAPAWLPQARPVMLDWQSPESLQRACAGADAIVHLAAMNEIDSARDPAAALDVNARQTLRLLDAAIAAKVPRILYMSTAHVYGAPLRGQIDERTLPRPLHPYAITHRVAEDFMLAALDAGKIEALVLRLSNGFGAPAHADVNRWTLLANDLCRQAVIEGSLTLSSSGLARRDFVTLEDVSRAVVHALSLPAHQLADGLFNLGGDAAMRVIDMAELIAARCEPVLGVRVPVRRAAPLQDERSDELLFSCAKLQGTGFTLMRNHAAEIDATLRLCAAAFGAADLRARA